MLLAITANAYSDLLGQFARLLRDPVCYGAGVPHGRGEPVLLIPGYTAGDWSLGAIAAWLRRVGYRPYLSGIDLNVGCPQRKLDMIGLRLEQIAESEGAPVSIIGHSLGGVLGRALASIFPARVRRVITLGSPVRMHWDTVREEIRPAMRVMQSFWQLVSDTPEECGTHACSCGFAEAAKRPAASPGSFDSIFSRADEVVDWRECLDDGGNNHEVAGGHVSLIVNKDVYRLLASILAQDPASGG